MDFFDRQTTIAIAFAIGAMLIFAIFTFAAPGGQSDKDRPTYAADDVRYKFQQAEAKERKNRKPGQPVKDQFVTDGSSSSGGDVSDDSGSSDNEEPSDDSSAEEPDAEEPPID